ncbi:hypothetical protein [Pseudanabaena sp. SR411]|uniref:hypothetical protein n=1 Tax=Pseudanabaena sp. SR411 TaxID=1980935 RepID=UPI00159638E5|nr:hypothetical protein [Pseudanabaena sp. SR411]
MRHRQALCVTSSITFILLFLTKSASDHNIGDRLEIMAHGNSDRLQQTLWEIDNSGDQV